ncbi:hypothetical protein [Kitasatospora sp. NPDC092286]|uniref:hypothetical protein n=1 Tax=Kitasatospora sp. NPDC092286 TaxID=3364087 RepID=UPI00382B07DF
MAGQLETRYGKVFDAIDTDSNGTVEWADYQRLVERVTKAYSLEADNDKVTQLEQAYQGFWTQLQHHGGGGDRMTKEQFVKALGEAVGSPAFTDMAVSGIAGALFHIANTDGNDQLGEDELKRLVLAVTNRDSYTGSTTLGAALREGKGASGVVDSRAVAVSAGRFLKSQQVPEITVGGLILGVYK